LLGRQNTVIDSLSGTTTKVFYKDDRLFSQTDPLSGVTAASLKDLGYVTPTPSTLLASGYTDPYALA